MFNLFRNRLSAAAIIAFTVGACCSPSEPEAACASPSEDPMTQPAASMESKDDDTAIPTQACGLAKLIKNDPDPPLYPYIGSAHWHVPWGQDYFDQGLRFFFAFNNRESYRAFRKAASEADENGIPCSACHWAQALPLGVDINMKTQSESDREAANVALDRAREANPNPKDDEIIRALRGRYEDCKNPDKKVCQQDRNRAYYTGMETVLKDFGSDDPNVITLFADSAMNLAPWAYWDEHGNPALDAITEAKKQLERALKFVQYPPNEGPIHWYIHLMEQSPTPDAAKQYADLLAPLAPNAGHLVHMPSHIYYRMGDMQNAIRANKEAIEADERYFGTEPDLNRPDDDRYIMDYYLHNIRFLIAAVALSGDNGQHDVDRYAEKLLQSMPDRASRADADADRTAFYLAKVNFSRTADIRKFERPNSFEQQPLANIAYAYTQLMADIWEKKDPTQSAGELDDDVAKYGMNARCDPAPGVQLHPIRCLPAILSNLGHAQVEVWKTNWDAAVKAAEDARDIQDAMRYIEPPLWLYPVGQTLASILIRRVDAGHGGPADLATAKQDLFTSLNKLPDGNPNLRIPTGTFPGNGWAYYGLWEIATRDGSPKTDIDKAWIDLNDHWLGTNDFRTLDRL